MMTLQILLGSSMAYYVGVFFTGAGVYEIGVYELRKEAPSSHLILGGAVMLLGLCILANH